MEYVQTTCPYTVSFALYGGLKRYSEMIEPSRISKLKREKYSKT